MRYSMFRLTIPFHFFFITKIMKVKAKILEYYNLSANTCLKRIRSFYSRNWEYFKVLNRVSVFWIFYLYSFSDGRFKEQSFIYTILFFVFRKINWRIRDVKPENWNKKLIIVNKFAGISIPSDFEPMYST